MRQPESCSIDMEEEEVEEQEQMMAVRSSRQKSGRADYQGDNADLDGVLTYTEWLEENGRTVFAVCASVTVLGLIVMVLLTKQ